MRTRSKIAMEAQVDGEMKFLFYTAVSLRMPLPRLA